MSLRTAVLYAGSSLASVGFLACANGPSGPSKSDHIPARWVTFLVEGAVRESTGLAVPVGARVTAQVQFDPETEGTFVPGNPALPDSEAPDAQIYSGVAVEVTVGDETVRANDRAASTIEISFLLPSADVFSVQVPNGFGSGRIAGQTISRFAMALLMIPSRWPDRSLPVNPSLFQSGFTTPSNNFFCLGVCRPFSGDTATGELTSISRLD